MLPSELIDLILSYASIKEAFQFPQYLSKSTILQLSQSYNPKTWLYEGNTQYFNIVEPYINFDWNNELFYYPRPIHINSIKQYRNKMNIKYLLRSQKLSSRFIETLVDKLTSDDWDSISSKCYLSENFIIKYEAHLQIEWIRYEFVPSDKYIEKYKNRLYWSSFYKNLPSEFIIKYHKYLNIQGILRRNEIPIDILKLYICELVYDYDAIIFYQPLTEELLYEYINKFSRLPYTQANALHFSENFLVKYANIVRWTVISSWRNLKECFIDKYQDKVDWCEIFGVQNLSDQFVEKHKHKIEQCIIGKHKTIENLWCNILSKPTISEKYVEENIDKTDFNSFDMNLEYRSEEFLIKYEDKVYWPRLYRFNKLSPTLINKHINQNFNDYKDNWQWYPKEAYFSYWDQMCQYQILPGSFIEMHKDKLNWYLIDRYQTHLSKEFRDRYRDKYYLDY